MRLSSLTFLVGVAVAGCGAQTPAQDRPDAGTPAQNAPVQTATAAAPNQINGDQAVINATPQVSPTEEERAQLRDLSRGLIDEAAKENAKGFSAVAQVEDEVVALQPTQVHNWRVQLQRGETYRIIGACDNECTDMDFELLDPTGKIIERDTLTDSFPIVNVSPTTAGMFTVRFLMKTCTLAPCYAAARLYHQTGSTQDARSDVA